MTDTSTASNFSSNSQQEVYFQKISNNSTPLKPSGLNWIHLRLKHFEQQQDEPTAVQNTKSPSAVLFLEAEE